MSLFEIVRLSALRAEKTRRVVALAPLGCLILVASEAGKAVVEKEVARQGRSDITIGVTPPGIAGKTARFVGDDL